MSAANTSEDEKHDAVELNSTSRWKKNKHRALAGFRHKIDMTQKELAERTGFPQSVISEYERGKRKLTLKAAMKLATYSLKVKPEQLLP